MHVTVKQILGVFMSAPQLVQELENRKQKNMQFFAQYFPDVHRQFKDKNMQNSRLNVNPENMEVNLVIDEKTVYPEPVHEFNKQEAQQFSDFFAEDTYNQSMRHNCYDDFWQGRYAHGLTAHFLKQLGFDDVVSSISPYHFGRTFAQLAFLGCGLGLHIKALLKIRPVKHVVVVEHDPDKFIASMYITDWEEIIMPYLLDKTTSFVLSVGNTLELEEKDRVHQAFAGVWNQICDNVPFLPIQTVFYIHKSDAFYTQVADRLNDEMEPFVNVWGYYDDEVNQFNHVMHNIRNGIGVLQKQDFSEDKRITLVCGNGPSLDTVIPLIKQYREKFNLIAAGSAIHSLLMQDIYPDACVSLESDKSSHEYFLVMPENLLKKLNYIGAAQIYPKSFPLFNKSLMYLKTETSYAKIFSKGEDIANGTPSATNAALAVAVELHFSNIYLVGLDYGFASSEKTHSDSSFYKDKNSPEELQNYSQKLADEAYLLEENQFGKIYTTPFYNTSRAHAERKIMSAPQEQIINLSQGATIERTTWGTAEELEKTLKQLDIDKGQEHFFDVLYKSARHIDKAEVEEGLAELQATFNEVKQKILMLVDSLHPNIDSIETCVFKINQLIVNPNRIKHKKGILFLRGSVWFWLFNLYAIAKRIDNKVDLTTLVKEWKHYFGYFITHIDEHLMFYIDDDAKNSKRLELSVSDAEPNFNIWIEACEQNHN